MKSTSSTTHSRAMALGAIALLLSISCGHAQTMLTVENEQASEPKAKKISLLVELELPGDSVSSVASEKKGDKYRLHVSDRAHRGQIEADQLRNQSVLPDLPAEKPEAPKQKFVFTTDRTDAGQ